MIWNDFLDAMGASRYLPHALCLTNDTIALFLFTLADMTTGVAYFTIGLCLILSKASVFTVRPAHIYLFAAFILLCGTSHLTMVATLYVGIYRLDILVRAAMAAVSIVTAGVVLRDFIAEKLWKAR